METKTYPRINVVFSSLKERDRFLKRVRKLRLTSSGVIRRLVASWVSGQIKLDY